MLTEIVLSPIEPVILPLVPVPCRAQLELLWRLDSRLDELSLSGREPALRQIRLAWWRDALASLDDVNARVPDEPFLREVAEGLLPTVDGAELGGLAEAKMAALASDWVADDVKAAGCALFALSARVLGGSAQPDGGAIHGLVSLALRLDDAGQRGGLLVSASRLAVPSGQLRALAVLDRLSLSIARRGGMRSRALEQALVLRVGLLGR